MVPDRSSDSTNKDKKTKKEATPSTPPTTLPNGLKLETLMNSLTINELLKTQFVTTTTDKKDHKFWKTQPVPKPGYICQ
jgi:hypothetical protein